MTEIQKRLFALQDTGYQAGSRKLNPTVDPQAVIGVRIPALRALAGSLKNTNEAKDFLAALPHRYFEEYQLHSFLIGFYKDFDEGVKETERLLPYLNSWALTDSFRVKAFDKAPEKLLPHIEGWLSSDHPYTQCRQLKTEMPTKPSLRKGGEGEGRPGRNESTSSMSFVICRATPLYLPLRRGDLALLILKLTTLPLYRLLRRSLSDELLPRRPL